MRRIATWLGWLLLLWGGVVAAATSAIPSQLQDWQAWVLHGHEQQTCALVTQPGEGNAGRQCVWPTRLALAVDKAGAHFQLDLHVGAESWVALPGDRYAWPQLVRVDNAPAVVLERGGIPTLRLAAGDHVVQGAMQWNERPARLRLPAAIALVDLKVDGVAISQSERNGDWITLGPAAARQREADALSLRVFRRLADGAPPTLETTLQLHVAGSAREQLLGPALPQGFVATALAGDLPARLDPDGRLRVQLRPGDWSLTLAARGIASLGKLKFQPPPAPWPQQEIWSYADAPALRSTRVAGVQSIDPGQANVPQAWRGLPAFVMDKDATLEVQQRARGQAAADDRLHLTRELWLDFDGGGLLADDHVVGHLRTTDRLDVAAPWTLTNARLGDDRQLLLVTRGDNSGSSGVEVRRHALNLRAGLRLANHAGAQAATGGWQHTLDGVDATLHLPYGYRLLGAPGADRSPDSWVAQWNLLDLFVVALIAILVWRWLGGLWALTALAFVVLSHGEPGAPLWAPAFAVALGLVARVLPTGKLRNVARYLGIAGLIISVSITLPFAATQLRDAMHPQLENTGLAGIAAGSVGHVEVTARTEFAPPPPPAPPPPQEQSVMSAPAAPPPPAQMKSVADASAQSLQTIVVTGVNAPAQNYPPYTILQSGRGVPDWANIGNAYRLGWSGPVTAQQTWRAVILPAWATRVLRVVMLALLLAWLAAIARAFELKSRLPRRPVAGIASLLLLAALAPQARAQSMPSPELLSQLQSRLLEAPQCAPQCASSPLAQVALQHDALQVTVEADAAVRVAFPLPYMDAPVSLRGVTLDGKPATQLAGRDGALWIALERGVHRVTMNFQFGGDAASAVLHFPLPPPDSEVSAPGWQTAGVDGSRLLSDTLTFTRERAAPSSDNPTQVAAQAFPPYVKLVRAITIGLDSRVDNVATRVSPTQGGFSVSVPLLHGEHVSDAGLKVEDGRVRITFAPDQDEVHWSSTLDAGKSLQLQAPGLADRAEEWRIDSAPLLHLTFKGIPESLGDATGGHVFRPLPGETLDVTITQPAAVPGNSVAFDRVALEVSRGDHALESTLTLITRSTRGGEQGITLPRDAQLLGAKRDGQALDLNLHDGHLALPVQPGTQTFSLRFRDATAIGMQSRTPAVSLGAPAANIRTTLNLPHDRWVLWTWGPQAGPAVLYWAQLLVLLIAAIVLAKFAPTPLRWWHWLLLGLGFSTFAWSAYALVVAWLIVLGWRARSERYVALTHSPFNALQILLATCTAIALLCLIASVPYGLLSRPDMRIAGMRSTAWSLHWFADQSSAALPQAGAFTLPLWLYKAAMLLWALWLANALIGWLRWGFDAWMRGGYWKPAPGSPKATLAEHVAADGDNAGT